MSNETITLETLKRVLDEEAGTDENADLTGDVLDVEFADLGYDSVALLETAARIERDYGITLDDDATTAAKTPRELLQLVNSS